jgi:outer membrane protein OmpA-like peptidoglycan-associated protein
MANALKPNPGALLRRGIGYALLAMSAGCATHAQQTQYPLSGGQPVKNSQGVCVQIGPTPANGQPECYQLAQPDLQHHVEPLPLDEFGYLFPPLKPEPKLASTNPPMPVSSTLPVKAVPVMPVTTAPIAASPIPTITPIVTPSIAATPVPVFKPAPVTIAPNIPVVASTAITAAPLTTLSAPVIATIYIRKILHFSTRLPFKLNSARLSRKNRADLLAFVNSLEQYRGVVSIRITGHTDRSGPARFNQWLSDMRAKSVQLWLLSLGIDPRTTRIRGVASTQPRPHARAPADNRYVDIEVVVRAPAP